MEFSAEPVEFKSLMVKRMLLNPQTTNTVWGNEVSRGNLAGVDDCRMLGKLCAEGSYVNILCFGEQPHNSVDVDRVVLSEIRVCVVHPIAIRTELHQQIRERLGNKDIGLMRFAG